VSEEKAVIETPAVSGVLFWRIAVVLLGVAVLVSALGVVYTKYQTRVLFAELQVLHAEADKMNVEWGQLQLEQSTKLTHGQVEQLARERLDMVLPSSEQVVVIRP